MLHVVGNLCLDTTLTVSRFPEPGETLVALASQSGLGGKGLNQAVAAARSGTETHLHAAVGFEDALRIARSLTNERRLSLQLTQLPQATDTSTVLVRPDGENLIVSAIACARAFVPSLKGEAVAPGDHLLMQGNLTPEATQTCLRTAKARGAKTVLNPSPLWATTPDWAAVDLVVLNAGELRALSHEADPVAGARRLLALGASSVVVTLGGRGAMWCDPARDFPVPAPAVAAVDTSGAGDVFCGVLVAVLARGIQPETAMAQATAAAALSVTRAGALTSCPTVEELAALAA